jgi:hypothetical protein
MKVMQKKLLFYLLLVLCIQVQAQTNFFKAISETDIRLKTNQLRKIQPEKYHTFSLNIAALTAQIQQAPMEFTAAARKNPLLLLLPLADGNFAPFEIVESPIMDASLSKRYPTIRTFSGRGQRERNMTLRCDITPNGFHAVINTEAGEMYLDPYATNQTENYVCYYTKDYRPSLGSNTLGFTCGTEMDIASGEHHSVGSKDVYANLRNGSELATLLKYRLALAATNEYCNQNGDTKVSVRAAMVETMNRVNNVTEKEVAVRMEMLDDVDTLIFLTPIADPFPKGSEGKDILGLIGGVINTRIGFTKYDIGHVFTGVCSDVGGVAGGQSCTQGKGSAVSCHSEGIQATPFAVSIVAHEMGHQMTASHTMSACDGVEPAQLSSSSMIEPGSGSTIMSYDGGCGSQNIDNQYWKPNGYYHGGTLDQIINWTRVDKGSKCGTRVTTDNHVPEISIPLGDSLYIPISTPFSLTGKAFDEDSDPLLFNWDQADENVLSTLGVPQGNSAIFRSLLPNSSLTRVFPAMATILKNGTDKKELLPTYKRNLTLRFIARDYRANGGGTIWKDAHIKATEKAGPFLVTNYNNSEPLTAGDFVELKWDVANTDGALVNCKKVNIILSTDAGKTFSDTLVKATANDGSEFVAIPNKLTNTARIMIAGANHIFFDVNDKNVKIEKATKPGFAFATFNQTPQVCLPSGGVVTIKTNSLDSFSNKITFDVVSGLPQGAVANFTQNDLNPSENTQLNFDMSNVTKAGTYSIKVRGIATGTDTLYRTITMKVVSNDFSDFAIVGPNGTPTESTLPTLKWKPTVNASNYKVEIATSPIFGNSIIDQGVSNTNQYIPNVTLSENTTYYWRARPINECGEANNTSIAGFHTKTFICNDAVTTTEVIIPVNGTSESVIDVQASGVISDVNVVGITGNHKLFLKFGATLVAPNGKEVKLIEQNCSIQSINLNNINFDDETTKKLECTSSNLVGSFLPKEKLATFIGDTLKSGTVWKLRLKSTEGGGKIKGWGLKFCYNVNLKNPFAERNTTMPVAPGKARLVSDTFLLVKDDNNLPEELTFTLLSIPAHGTLNFQGKALKIGDTFRQSSINSKNVSYAHSGDGSTADAFTFAVQDTEGGFYGSPTFKISIDPNAPVLGVDEKDTALEKNLSIYPNPTTGDVTIEFRSIATGNIVVQVFNPQGQLLRNQTFNASNRLELNLNDLSSGVYFLAIRTSNAMAVKRVVVNK